MGQRRVGGVVVTEKDPDSQGKELSLWPKTVILIDTGLASRERGVRSGGRENVKKE